ncbi:MAG TPA: hypothetical protein VFZ58_04175 [Candidatus Saccharimonadales bacterium]
MDTNQNQPISDDQELAKVLQGVQKQARDMATHDPEAHSDNSLQYEEMPAPGVKADTKTVDPPAAATSTPPPVTDVATTDNTVVSPAATDRNNPALDAIKKEALEELRPLVTKLDLPAKEKFDTMLLIIRSTDDTSLLAPAHESAKAIEDETERAEALLDIVKEIDYFASQKAA